MRQTLFSKILTYFLVGALVGGLCTPSWANIAVYMMGSDSEEKSPDKQNTERQNPEEQKAAPTNWTPPVTQLKSFQMPSSRKWKSDFKHIFLSAAFAAPTYISAKAGHVGFSNDEIVTGLVGAGAACIFGLISLDMLGYVLEKQKPSNYLDHLDAKDYPRPLAKQIRAMNKDYFSIILKNKKKAAASGLWGKKYIHGYSLAHLAALRSVDSSDIFTPGRIFQHLFETEGPEQAFLYDDHRHTPFEFAMMLGNTAWAEPIADSQLQQYKREFREVPATIRLALDILETKLGQQYNLLKGLVRLAVGSNTNTSMGGGDGDQMDPDSTAPRVARSKKRQLQSLFSAIIAGADVKQLTRQMKGLHQFSDAHGITALHIALAAGNYPVAQFLMDGNAPLKGHKNPSDVQFYPILASQVRRSIRFAQVYIKKLQGFNFEEIAQTHFAQSNMWQPVRKQILNIQQLIDQNKTLLASHPDACPSLLSNF